MSDVERITDLVMKANMAKGMIYHYWDSDTDPGKTPVTKELVLCWRMTDEFPDTGTGDEAYLLVTREKHLLNCPECRDWLFS